VAVAGLIVNDASKRVRFDLPLTGTTDFTVTVVSASDWMVSWNLTGSGFTLESVLIKDGVSSPNNLLYRFYPVIGW
jgi:hypothetical protein